MCSGLIIQALRYSTVSLGRLVVLRFVVVVVGEEEELRLPSPTLPEAMPKIVPTPTPRSRLFLLVVASILKW